MPSPSPADRRRPGADRRPPGAGFQAEGSANLERAVGVDGHGDREDSVAVIRSEERLVAHTRRVAVQRVRLEKFVTTETVTVEVQVRREKVRLVREPLSLDDSTRHDTSQRQDHSDRQAGGAEGPGGGAEAVVVVLHEERPVINLEAVPVERVRMTVETVRGAVDVPAEVRTEHVVVETPDAG